MFWWLVSGISSRKLNFYRHWRSALGRCLSSFLPAYFDAHGSQAVNDAISNQGKLIKLFNRIEHFFRRLEIYTGVTLTAAMTDIITDIMVEVLSILAIVTKDVKRGRLSELIMEICNSLLTPCLEKYIKMMVACLTGNTDIEDSLQRLDELTQEEARMASAELLKVTHNVDDKVTVVDNRVKGVEDKVEDVHSEVQDVGDKVQGVDDRMQDIGCDVKDISREVRLVREVDNKLDQANRSLFL
jgi:archaellum component FlaC